MRNGTPRKCAYFHAGGGDFPQNFSAVDSPSSLLGLAGFEELGQDAMSVLAERCREAGLEDLFKTSLK